MSMKNLSFEKREEWTRGTDITALDEKSKEKVLLRIVEPKSKSGFIGIDAVKEMMETIESEDFNRGVLFGKKFTVAAKRELMENDIQRISENHMPKFKPERLYLQINQLVNDLCKVKCGKIPQEESDCKGDCRIRVVSDNGTFHFEQGWIDLMKDDMKQLFAIRHSEESN